MEDHVFDIAGFEIVITKDELTPDGVVYIIPPRRRDEVTGKLESLEEWATRSAVIKNIASGPARRYWLGRILTRLIGK
jgi:hypothetical protein